jgi:hypothetical protein
MSEKRNGNLRCGDEWDVRCEDSKQNWMLGKTRKKCCFECYKKKGKEITFAIRNEKD